MKNKSYIVYPTLNDIQNLNHELTLALKSNRNDVIFKFENHSQMYTLSLSIVATLISFKSDIKKAKDKKFPVNLKIEKE